MNTGQRILKNFLSLTFADFVTKLLGFVIAIYLARIFNPYGFGILNFSISIVNYFLFISDPGLTTYGVKKISQNPLETKKWINDIFTIRLFLSLLAFLAILIVIFFLNEPFQVKLMIFFYGLMVFPQSVSPNWVYQGIQKMEYAAVYNILLTIVYALLTLLLVKGLADIMFVPINLITAYLLASLLLLIPIIKIYGWTRSKINFKYMSDLIKSSIPIGIASFLICGINWNLSITLLGLLKNHTEVGYFSVAFKIILAVIGISVAFGISIFPAMSYYGSVSKETLKRIINISERLIAIIGIPLIFGTLLTADSLIYHIFGNKYTNSILPLKILISGALIYAFNIIYFNYMIAIGKQKENMNISIIRTLLLLILSLIFIKNHNSIGASWAYVISELGTLFIYSKKITSDLKKANLFIVLIKPLIASVLMFLIFSFYAINNVFAEIFWASIIYLILIFLLGGIKKEDVKKLTDYIRIKQ